MPSWVDHKLESRVPGEVSTSSDMQIIMAEIKEELKSLLMMVKDKSRKSGLNSTFRKLRS